MCERHYLSISPSLSIKSAFKMKANKSLLKKNRFSRVGVVIYVVFKLFLFLLGHD